MRPIITAQMNNADLDKSSKLNESSKPKAHANLLCREEIGGISKCTLGPLAIVPLPIAHDRTRAFYGINYRGFI